MKRLMAIGMFAVLACCVVTERAGALERPGVEYKIFQFPRNMIPRIDGKTDDWDMVPDDYAIGTGELMDTVNGNKPDPKNLDIKVKLGWVKGLDRLYILYEAYDDYWDFKDPGLTGDIFEIVVDADLSGGPLIANFSDDLDVNTWAGYLFHGVHAQNYHIFTPAEGKNWTLAWGCQPWIADLPWANAVYSYNFKHGESGRLVLECWITPFDYAAYEGPSRSVVSKLEENKIIGFSWAILDRDDPSVNRKGAFWNLSHNTRVYGDASALVAFRLMPLEERFKPAITAGWSFTVVDQDRRLVAFKDESTGNIRSWHWDFGDGTVSTEQHPVHRYEAPGSYRDGNTYPYSYIVVLTVEGPDGKARMSKIWDVAVK
ncbi:PKD domain-containing protein [bacterium]|nr:PKD domain-containing protein [bacterium]